MKFILLTEKYLNLFSEPEKRKYVDEVWDILQLSYGQVGGIMGSGFSSKEDMIKNIPMWKLSRKEERIVAAILYKSKKGRKKVAIATDKSIAGIEALKKMLIDDFVLGRSYGEISDPSLKFVKRIFGAEFDKYKIPAEKVKELLKGKEIIPVDDYELQKKNQRGMDRKNDGGKSRYAAFEY